MDPVLRQLEAAVTASLLNFCDRKKYQFSSRTKSLESMSEKLETGRYSTLSVLDDLLACTIVIPTIAHEPGVLAFLRGVLTQTGLRSRSGTQKAPDVFRFDATRFYGRFSPPPNSGYDARVGWLTVEVQIHTAFEHAWVVVTHDLTFKSPEVDWRRLRLAAQLKAAVEQLDLMVNTFEETAVAVAPSHHAYTDRLATIVARCRKMVDAGMIAKTLEPGSWSRFAENVDSLVGSYTTRRDERSAATESLLDAIEAAVSASGYVPPVGGSLFQLVIGVVSSSVGSVGLENFPIIDGDELRNVHSVRDIPNPLNLDWPEA
jgi:hypothetical protein